MKFGKSLSSQIEETLPEWRDEFLSYKDLKKKLKLIGAGGHRPAKRARVREEEAEFLTLIEAELEKFNGFFIEKEEGFVIRQKELQDQVAIAVKRESREELIRVCKEIVDFHGEMVLLENYSSLNYTGLVKILKKYDKRTGALIRLPFIQRVLQQPFFTTDLLNMLVKDCESLLDSLFLFPSPVASFSCQDDEDGNNGDDNEPHPQGSLVNGEVPELEEMEYMESLYMKSTVAALRSLEEIRSRSSTVSVFSLPPLTLPC